MDRPRSPPGPTPPSASHRTSLSNLLTTDSPTTPTSYTPGPVPPSATANYNPSVHPSASPVNSYHPAPQYDYHPPHTLPGISTLPTGSGGRYSAPHHTASNDLAGFHHGSSRSPVGGYGGQSGGSIGGIGPISLPPLGGQRQGSIGGSGGSYGMGYSQQPPPPQQQGGYPYQPQPQAPRRESYPATHSPTQQVSSSLSSYSASPFSSPAYQQQQHSYTHPTPPHQQQLKPPQPQQSPQVQQRIATPVDKSAHQIPPGGAPVRKYLNENVTGAVLEGMKILAATQPKEPLLVLARFLEEEHRKSEKVNGDGEEEGDMKMED